MKKIFRITVVFALLIGVYWLFSKMKWVPSFSTMFGSSPVLIDETPLLITEIKQIATLLTMEASDEVVVSQVRPAQAGSPKKILEWISPTPVIHSDRLVLVVKGKVFAGTDMSNLDSSHIFVLGDSVSVTLPAAQIQDIIVNPSGTNIFIEEGNWSQEATNILVQKAREKLQQRAIEKGILSRADEQALLILQQFLQLQGFQKIRVVTQS